MENNPIENKTPQQIEQEKQQKILREALKILERLSEQKFNFIDPTTGLLIKDGTVIDVQKEKEGDGDWIVTVLDSENNQIIKTPLTLFVNIELIVSEPKKLGE